MWAGITTKTPNYIRLTFQMQCCVLLPESSFLTLKDGLCSPPEMDLSEFCETSQQLVKWAILYFPGCKTQMKEMVTVLSLSFFVSQFGR